MYDEKRQYVLNTLKPYWTKGSEAVGSLPMPRFPLDVPGPVPPRMIEVALPDWGFDAGIDGVLLAPEHLIAAGQDTPWSRTDWLAVVFWYLNGAAERVFEHHHGPIGSYSRRLQGWDPRLWDRAWVNRIALFLRRWAAHAGGRDEDVLCGFLPAPKIILTHDVDYISKTLALRIKQTGFSFFNGLMDLRHGRLRHAIDTWLSGLRFFMRPADYWCFDQIADLERQNGFRSHFNIYGGPGGWRRTPGQMLMDPAYCIARNSALKKKLRELWENGWTIGLHPSYGAWNYADSLRQEKQTLERAIEAPVVTVRQHWLRFSWDHTWRAQQEAGLELDTTLGFNDRPGFRNGAALQFHPWDPQSDGPIRLAAIPMILMDSHLYDYAVLTDTRRAGEIAHWLHEIHQVHGVATIIWHQRVMSTDYGWGGGYRTLIELMTKTGYSTTVPRQPDSL